MCVDIYLHENNMTVRHWYYSQVPSRRHSLNHVENGMPILGIGILGLLNP